MPKRISDRARLINYAMNCTEEEINFTVETLRAIASNRFPKAKSQPKKKVGKKTVGVQTSIDDFIEPADGNAVAETKPAKKAKGNGDRFVPDPDVMRMVEESKAEAAP